VENCIAGKASALRNSIGFSQLEVAYGLADSFTGGGDAVRYIKFASMAQVC
jgi:hypothetical protein